MARQLRGGSAHRTIEIASLLKERRQEILHIAARHGAYNVRVFGSTASGESGPDSDVDFLVDMEPGRSLFDMGGLLVELQDLLGRQVDVVTEQSLHWYIRDQVIAEAQLL
jgi:predicted nucleotidyltransferase